MRKKINLQMVGITTLAILATLAMTVTVFYELFKQQIFEDLKTYAHILSVSQTEENISRYDKAMEDVRITLIDGEGVVLYDSFVDAATLGNHKDRPEIADAFATGNGSAVRKSDTLDMSTFYYAFLMEDGNIIRVAKEADSLLSIIGNALPILIFIGSALFLICMVLSHVLAGSLLKPIEQMATDIDSKEDITAYEELRPFIQTIRRQHEDIIKNARIRQEFTANVSHELKTPLTAISGYSELIETGMASEQDTARFAKEIHKNANRLLTLINDTIQLSELDAGSDETVFEEVNLYELARTCVDMLQMNAGKHKVSLTMDGQNCTILANKQMMEEVLYNLCDNAIRYNNEGGYVRVGIYPEKDDVVLSVEDSGIGIPQEHQQRIFERFYRVDKSRSKSTGGTGLGLAIVKHILAKHNAELFLHSEVGKGTKITIHFNKN